MCVMKETTKDMKDQFANKGFISTSFLIVLLIMMSIVFLKIDMIIGANTIYDRLKSFQDVYKKESAVIEYAKCMLLHDGYIEDFYIDGISVDVYQYHDSYSLYFDDYCIDIDTYERKIISLNLSLR